MSNKKNKRPVKPIDPFLPVDSVVHPDDALYKSIISDMMIPESELTNATSKATNKLEMEKFKEIIDQYQAEQEKQMSNLTSKITSSVGLPQWAMGSSTVSGSSIASGTITSISYPTQTIAGMGGQQYIVQGAPQYQYSTTTGTSAPAYGNQWGTSTGYAHVQSGQMTAALDEIWVADAFDFLEFFFDKAPVPVERDKKYKHSTKISTMMFHKDVLQDGNVVLALKLPSKRIWVHDGISLTAMPRRTHMFLATLRNEIFQEGLELISEPMSVICKHCRMLINEHPTSPKNHEMHKCMFEPTYFTPLTPQDLA